VVEILARMVIAPVKEGEATNELIDTHPDPNYRREDRWQDRHSRHPRCPGGSGSQKRGGREGGLGPDEDPVALVKIEGIVGPGIVGERFQMGLDIPPVTFTGMGEGVGDLPLEERPGYGEDKFHPFDIGILDIEIGEVWDRSRRYQSTSDRVGDIPVEEGCGGMNSRGDPPDLGGDGPLRSQFGL